MNIRSVLAAVVTAGFAVIVGCSSSSGSQSAPTCKGNTTTTGPGGSECSACTEQNCGSQIAAVQANCSAYVSCFAGCDCSDLSCISGCLSKIDATCENADGPLAACLSSKCATPCGATSGSPDGG